MLNQKNKVVLVVAVVVLVVCVAGAVLYFAKQQTNPTVLQPVSDLQIKNVDEISPKQVDTKNVYHDQQLNYLLTLPNGWIANEVKSYPKLSMSALIKQFNPAWRALEVARVYISSNASLSDCVKMARGIDSCLANNPQSDIQTGAYVSVAVDYRGEATIEEVVARDVQEIGASFAPADTTIAGTKTFAWSNAPACKDCPFSKTYIFNGKPHFTYRVTEELYKNPKESLPAEAQAQYMQDLKTAIASLELR